MHETTNTVIEQTIADMDIGDLVEIHQVSPETSFFGWGGKKLGIYLGTFEFTHYMNKDNKKTDVCHKVWVSGEIKFVSTIQEMKILAKVGQSNERV